MTAKLFTTLVCLAGLLQQAYGQDELKPLLDGGCSGRCESALYQRVCPERAFFRPSKIFFLTFAFALLLLSPLLQLHPCRSESERQG